MVAVGNHRLDSTARGPVSIEQGRWTKLIPVSRAHYDELFELAATYPHMWRWNGRPISPDSFQQSLWDGVLTQYVAVSAEANDLIGIVSAYEANLFHGHAYVLVAIKREYQARGWPLEAVGLFVEHLFENYGTLYKLYGRMEGNSEAPIALRFLNHEATLQGHFARGNQRVDLVILSLSRDQWYQDIRQRFNALTRATSKL